MKEILSKYDAGVDKLNVEIAKSNYKKACNDLLKLFCDKYSLQYSPECWIGRCPGKIACVSDYYVDIETIIDAITLSTHEDEFSDWYDYCLQLAELGEEYPDFQSWVKGCARLSEKQIENLRMSHLLKKQ